MTPVPEIVRVPARGHLRPSRGRHHAAPERVDPLARLVMPTTDVVVEHPRAVAGEAVRGRVVPQGGRERGRERRPPMLAALCAMPVLPRGEVQEPGL